MTPIFAAQLALRCLDLTSLNDGETAASTEALAQRANTRHGPPAALCVYAPFVALAREALNRQDLHAVRVATVVNFPRGQSGVAQVVREIDAALAAGADEIDTVFPWQALRAGDAQAADAGKELVAACRRACDTAGRSVVLKVILETGELRDPALIRQASQIAVSAGADFLKTSTGKVKVNATPEAVRVMLDVIAEHGGRIGLKVAGGVSSLADVQAYLALATQACGADWLTPAHLRFGASSLLPVLLAALDGDAPDLRATAAY